MTRDWETLLPLLNHIQARLEEDLALDALGRKAGLSPFHLQRLFKAAIGETPKAYTSRLRLERAAFRLLVHDSNVLDIALECGFQSHETFLRAFRRRFGQLPSEYREQARKWTGRQEEEPAEPSSKLGQGAPPAFELSSTRVVPLRSAHLAFRRHVGPYESVPESLFDELEEWATRRRVPGPRVWMGIGHDAPGITPAAQLRFDAALVVPGAFAPEGPIAHQLLPGGSFAVTTHAGPYETLPEAYAAIFPRLLALPGHRLVGLPAVEIYNTTRVNVSCRLNHTDLCLPVTPLGS